MSIFQLKSKFKAAGDQGKAIAQLLAGLGQGYDKQTLLGVTGSGKTFSIASVIADYAKPALVIAPNKALAAQLYREYKNFFPKNAVHFFVSYYDYYQPEAYLPNTDTYIDKEAMVNEEIDRLRHAASSALLSRSDVIIVASVSCIYNLGMPLNYLEARISLSQGHIITRSDLINQLIKLLFKRTNGELKGGEFRIRANNFEIKAKSDKDYYRLEFQDDVLLEIYKIDELSKKIIDKLGRIDIFPPKHFISTEDSMKQSLENIRQELKDRLKYFKAKGLVLEAERLSRRTNYDLEMLSSLGYCHGVENYSRHLSNKLAGETPDSLLSYFPKDKDNQPDFLTIIDESHITIPQLRAMYAGDRSRKETLVKYAWRLPSALDNRPLMFEEFLARVGPMIFSSATPGPYELKHSKQIVEQIIRPTYLVDPLIEIRKLFDKERNYSQIDDVIKEAELEIKQKKRVIINTLTKKQAEDLSEYLNNKGLKTKYLHSEIKTLERTEILKDFRLAKFDILIGVNLLREGLDLPELSLVAILDADREGFLRSETALLQSMGRAARNLSGRIILYADKETPAIKGAVSESIRRRKKQLAYNKKMGTKARTVSKKIEDFLDLEPSKDKIK